jgi:hypothetical protein
LRTFWQIALTALVASQNPQVDADISLLRKKPKGMDEDTWREKRRDAARELGDLGDKKAVDPLLEIVQAERFDAILEIAIQSLGKLGDNKAVPVLQRIADDPSIETYVRDTAREALRKLGAAPAERGGGNVGVGGERKAGGAPPDLSALVKTQGQVEGMPALNPPSLPAGTLALAETLSIGGGLTPAVSFQHNSAGGGTLFDLSLAGEYNRQMEHNRFGYTFGSTLGAGYHSISIADTTDSLIDMGVGIAADGRLYLIDNVPLFEFITLAPSIAYHYTKQQAMMTATRDTTVIDFSVAGGIGWGRVMPVGARMKLHRIEGVLETAGLKARPINGDASARVMLAWYGLRGRLGYYAELLWTLRILREAGVLLQEPDAATVYKILQVISDPQMDDRYEGMDLRLGGFYSIESTEVDVPNLGGVMWAATLAHQIGDRADFVGHLRGALQANQDPKGILTSADFQYRMFFYSAEQDPQGALALGPFANLCSDACPLGPTTGLVWDVGARALFTRWFSRASNVAAGFEFATESAQAWRAMFTLSATYGLAPASLAF